MSRVLVENLYIIEVIHIHVDTRSSTWKWSALVYDAVHMSVLLLIGCV